MSHEMRRRKQALSPEDCREIFDRGTNGVLALAGDDGCPYAVPLSYVRAGDVIYFHCAAAGHKLELIRQNPRASFCVVDQDEIIPEKYTTCYRSAIAFGSIRILEDAAEKREAAALLAKKYAPEDSESNRQGEIDRWWDALCVLELSIQRMTGKEARELAERRIQNP